MPTGGRSDVVSTFAGRLTIIDNHLMFAQSAMLGAKALEVHLCNYWPEWGIKLLDRLEARDYAEVQRMMVDEAKPFYKLWVEIEKNFTSGDGYLDKLCMELIGLDSSRCRPPTRDVRDKYREQIEAFLRSAAEETRAMWLEAEPQILALVVQIARKVVKSETAINPEVVVEVVKNSLRRVVDGDSVRVRVHADDLENLRAARADILSVIDVLRNVEIIEDRRDLPTFTDSHHNLLTILK